LEIKRVLGIGKSLGYAPAIARPDGEKRRQKEGDKGVNGEGTV